MPHRKPSLQCHLRARAEWSNAPRSELPLRHQHSMVDVRAFRRSPKRRRTSPFRSSHCYLHRYHKSRRVLRWREYSRRVAPNCPDGARDLLCPAPPNLHNPRSQQSPHRTPPVINATDGNGVPERLARGGRTTTKLLLIGAHRPIGGRRDQIVVSVRRHLMLRGRAVTRRRSAMRQFLDSTAQKAFPARCLTIPKLDIEAAWTIGQSQLYSSRRTVRQARPVNLVRTGLPGSVVHGGTRRKFHPRCWRQKSTLAPSVERRKWHVHTAKPILVGAPIVRALSNWSML